MRNQAAIVMAILLGASLTASGTSKKGKSPKPKVTMAQAEAIALARQPGKIESEDLETEDGELLYSFYIRNGNGLHEVEVDALTGQIVDDSIETAPDQAKESRKENKVPK